MKEVTGNLITLANNNEFDVIVHGCNCFCTQKSGLAPQMVKAYGTDKFPMEAEEFKGDLNKLGQIDYKTLNVGSGELIVVNAYSQYSFGRVSKSNPTPPVDYDALRLIFRKMNTIFKGKRIGLPGIGTGLAGGSLDLVKTMMIEEFTDCDITFVTYDGN
jgi:O-acetyl-ADP-ribose deacetylase (regulator of RNase III)